MKKIFKTLLSISIIFSGANGIIHNQSISIPTNAANKNTVSKIQPFSNVKSHEKQIWQDVGNKDINFKPDYSNKKLNLLNILKKVDILYDPHGFGGLTGNVLIVQGKFKSESQNTYYMRAIEASGYFKDKFPFLTARIMYSIVDDTNFLKQKYKIFRVNNIDNKELSKVVSFAKAQIGKPYNFHFTQPGTNINKKSWYCSEIVWASYKSIGIDIINNKKTRTPLGVTPRDITSYSPKAKEVKFYI